MKPLSDEEWGNFFDYVNRIVNQPRLTAKDKNEQFKKKVKEYYADTDCDELAAYLVDD